ncbi:MAG: hypothetical protein E7214_03325 [Clostridium sp.]|nr:hypothetical protein [Clostridium sp.]
MNNKNIVELIREFGSIDKEDKKGMLAKQQEILYALIDQEYIYTLLGEDTTVEEFENNTGRILSGPDSVGRPCFRIFSDRSLAEECARRYELTIDTENEKDKPLVLKVRTDGMMKTAYNAMFKGLFAIILNDGSNWLNIIVKDFVNALYTHKGEEELVSNTDFMFINLFHMIQFTDQKAYIIASSNNTDETLSKPEFALDAADDSLRLFFDEKLAKDYAQSHIGDEKFAVAVDALQLNNLVVGAFVQRPEMQIRIIYGNVQLKKKLAKVQFLIDKLL